MENKREKETFAFTYSAKQQEEVQNIRKNTFRRRRIKWSSCAGWMEASAKRG